MKYKLFTDGGARGNPGPAGIGLILFNEDNGLLAFEGKYIGMATNNIAEYQAILLGIKIFKKYLLVHSDTDPVLECYLDSELIVKQMKGEYKVKDAGLKTIYSKVQENIQGMNVTFSHVRREKNKFADKLVNISLDAANAES